MAMNVKFLKGTLAQYTTATKDEGTLYFITDAPSIYLGSTLIADKTVLDTNTVNSLVEEALKDFYTKEQIDAFIETINGSIADVDAKFASYRTSAAQDEIDNGIKADIKAISDDYLVEADKTELEGKITAHETAVNTKFNDYSTTAQMNSAISTATTDMATNASVDGKLANYRTSTAQDAIDQAQDKALTDAINAEVQRADGKYELAGAETRAKEYADKKLEDFEKAYITEDGGTIDKLNEIAAWIADDEAGAVKIIADVATNAANIATNVADLDKVEAKLNGIAEGNGTVKTYIDNVDAKFADYTKTSDLGDLATKDESELNLGQYAKTADISDNIAKGVTAHGWGDHAQAGYAKDAELGDLAKKDEADLNLKALAHKDTIDETDLIVDKVVTKAKLEESVQASLALVDTAVQPEDLGALASVDSISEIKTAQDKSHVYVTNTIDQGGAEVTGTGVVHFADSSAGSWEFDITEGTISHSLKGSTLTIPSNKNDTIAVSTDVSAAEGRAAADATSKANAAEANAKADATSKANTAEANAKSYADGLLAALRGAADANVTIEALVKAINKCIKGTEETTLQTASLTDNINNLDSRADAIESVLTWGTIGE